MSRGRNRRRTRTEARILTRPGSQADLGSRRQYDYTVRPRARLGCIVPVTPDKIAAAERRLRNRAKAARRREREARR